MTEIDDSSSLQQQPESEFISLTFSQDDLALIVSKGENLTVIVSNSEKNKMAIPEFCSTTGFEDLTESEEERVKAVVFSEDLHFSVPVNIRDSKNAYLILQGVEPEPELEDLLMLWALESLDIEPKSEEQVEPQI